MDPRLLTRLLATATVVLALACAFLVGTSVGRDDPGPAGTRPAAYTGRDVSVAKACDDLLEWYVDRGVEAVGPDGWGSPYPLPHDLVVDGDSRASDAEAAAPTTSRAISEASGTNVQESGVDEPDAVKTDGSTLYRVADGDLTTYDVSGATVARIGSLDLTSMDEAELLLARDTLVVIGTRGAEDEPDAATRVLVVDVSDPAQPSVRSTTDYDTGLMTARLHGDVVRLMLRAGLPDLDFVGGGQNRDPEVATRANQDVVRASTVGDWLPAVSTDGGDEQQLLDCDQVALPDDEAGLGTVAVVGLDLAADDPVASVTGLAVDTDLVYASTDRLYLAVSTVEAGWPTWCGWCRSTVESGADGQTRLYGFTLEGTETVLTASGRVDGSIADRWSLDAYDDTLRIAVGPTSRTGDTNAILTLGEDGDDLVELGRVDGLGPGETIRSMRWFDGLALMVTFREVDPLYAVDLSDPERPTLIGELKIPGFSAYLHPLGEQRLVGVGEGPDADGRWGAQLALFDVTDLTTPTRLDLLSYAPGSVAQATLDPRQFTWLPDERTVLTVVAEGRTGYVSVVRLEDGGLSNRMVEVEQGSEVDAVRLVPLVDGRVVLVTGDGASFLDVR